MWWTCTVGKPRRRKATRMCCSIAGPIVRYKTIDQELFSGQPRHVYAIDYRKYWRYGMAEFVDKYDIDDVIVMPYLIATQAMDGNDMFRSQMH